MSNNYTEVVLVSPVPPPSGGVATWTLNLLLFWQENKEKTSDISLTHVSNARRFGNITNRNRLIRILTGILNSCIFFWKFFNVLRLRKGARVVHLTTSGSFGFVRDALIVLIARFRGAKLILHLRFGRVPALMQIQNWEFVLLKFLLRWSHNIISIDKQTFEVLHKEYGNRVIYVPNAVSPIFLNAGFILSPENDEITKAPSILFVGHVVKSKGIFDLIRVAGEIGHLRIKIAGISKPNELEVIMGLQMHYLTLEIEILGNLTAELLIKELQSCTLFCLPSYTEGFPNAVLEAMAVGAPIVASEVGEIAEMVNVNDESAAWLFQAGDLEGLKRQIVSALTDPMGRSYKSQLCIQKVNLKYTPEVVFDQLIHIWKNASENRYYFNEK